MEISEKKWERLEHGFIDIPLLEYLENIIIKEHELNHTLKICIGTDSQRKNKRYKYSTVIIIEMKEAMGIEKGKMIYKGLGAKVITGSSYDRSQIEIQERMLMEVQMSIDVGYYLIDLIKKYNIEFEIHADVNPNPKWGSNVALSAAVGYITGMGFTCKTKPLAYAASTIADKQCNS